MSKISTREIDLSTFFAPRGFLINGKIVVTDAAGITVAIKTLAGTDPSASDPVYCRIGDTVRSITSALSFALADGTNWMNAGSAELATKEIDYFAYLVWDSNSSAVGLSFARIPYANLVSDFSATTTNEKYCAGYSDFTTTDEVENIGRFAATLSAGAGYTWTVPTFTASNLIQRPIFETRWLNWTPVFTTISSMTFTSTSELVARYKVTDAKVHVMFRTVGTTGGTASNEIRPSIPFVAPNWQPSAGNYLDTGLTSTGLVFTRQSEANMTIRKYDGVNFGLGVGKTIGFNGIYEL